MSERPYGHGNFGMKGRNRKVSLRVAKRDYVFQREGNSGKDVDPPKGFIGKFIDRIRKLFGGS